MTAASVVTRKSEWLGGDVSAKRFGKYILVRETSQREVLKEKWMCNEVPKWLVFVYRKNNYGSSHESKTEEAILGKTTGLFLNAQQS